MRCERPTKCQRPKPCQTKARLSLPTILPVGRQESVLKVPKRGQFHGADSCDTETFMLQFVCPRSTRETDGIAVKVG